MASGAGDARVRAKNPTPAGSQADKADSQAQASGIEFTVGTPPQENCDAMFHVEVAVR